MKIVKKIQNSKVNSLTWYEISEKIQKSKINSLTWYDFIEYIFFGPQLSIKISIFNEKSNFWYSDHPEITPGLNTFWKETHLQGQHVDTSRNKLPKKPSQEKSAAGASRLTRFIWDMGVGILLVGI